MLQHFQLWCKLHTDVTVTAAAHKSSFVIWHLFQKEYNRSTPVFGDGRISTHADPTSTSRTIFHERRISSVNLMSVHVYANVYIGVGARACSARSPINLILGFWKAKFQKLEIPRPGRQWTTVQNLITLALSLPDKSVTVQNDKITNKQTNKQ